MTARHLEFLVEEPSMEAFLGEVLQRILPEGCSHAIYPFQGKGDLLKKLKSRLCGYARWLPEDCRIIVVVDRDADDCRDLKKRLEKVAAVAGLRTRTASGAKTWQLVNRIVVEELEAWYFGEWEAVRSAFPGLPSTPPQTRAFRHPDAVSGGTWEAFERVLKKNGYFKTGLRKIEAARAIGARFDPGKCCSPSFCRFYEAVREAVS